MIEVELTKNFTALIDDVDRDLDSLSWYITAAGYAARSATVESSRKMIYLHRVILERKIGRNISKMEICDHINGNTLDNSRDNLRIANYSQSVHNTRKKHSGLFKGVYFDKSKSLWVSRIMTHRKNHHIGYFRTSEEAAKAYDFHAIEFHKEFASLNFPDQINETIQWWNNYVPAAQINNYSGSGRGVWKNGNRWAARITLNGKRIYLGSFITQQDANAAYNAAFIESRKK